jgi:TIR domain
MDVFISHAQADLPLAQFLHRHLSQEGLSAYLATVSMAPGEQWKQVILDNLRSSTWVICLASRAACESHWVMQEMGVAIGANKKLVPIVWDISPQELPGWMREYQAVNLGGANQEVARAAIERISETIKSEKQKGLVILGMVIAGLMLFGR